MKTALYAVLLIVAMTSLGCQTITSPFTSMKPDYTNLPVEDLHAVALQIEQAIEAGEREPVLEDRPELVLGKRVRQAIRTRATRAELIDELRNTGFAWERQNGLLAIIRSRAYQDATDRRQRDRDANVVMGENDDRWAIYEGLIDDNDYPNGSRGAIQEAFFEARMQTLESGQLYEDESGEAVAK